MGFGSPRRTRSTRRSPASCSREARSSSCSGGQLSLNASGAAANSRKAPLTAVARRSASTTTSALSLASPMKCASSPACAVRCPEVCLRPKFACPGASCPALSVKITASSLPITSRSTHPRLTGSPSTSRSKRIGSERGFATSSLAA